MISKKVNIAVWAFIGAALFLVLQLRSPGPWVGSDRLVIIGLFAQTLGGALLGAACASIVNFILSRR